MFIVIRKNKNLQYVSQKTSTQHIKYNDSSTKEVNSDSGNSNDNRILNFKVGVM